MERLKICFSFGASRGFSLLELLVVVAVMLILLGLGVTSFSDVQRAYGITTGAENVRNALLLARLEATSRSRTLEVRFCRLDADSPVRDLQVVLHEPDGSLSLRYKMRSLPESLLLEIDTTRSTLFTYPNKALNASGSNFVANDAGNAFPINGSPNYEVFSFFIYPDGTSSQPWSSAVFPSVTLRSIQNLSEAPENYAVIQIDPANGRSSILRP